MFLINLFKFINLTLLTNLKINSIVFDINFFENIAKTIKQNIIKLNIIPTKINTLIPVFKLIINL